MALSFMEGNEALARGAIAAGCNFFAGYPITPATTIFNSMLQMLPPKGGICVQGEDEIASMGYCIGAAMAGKKALTATSGPGISLYSEQISFAIGSEIPLVIADVQRLGPSTGSATRGADSDIQFLRWGSTSGVPVIVLVPTDALDCYVLAVHAFNYAEEFRCPVFIASNKEIGMTKESFDLDSVTLPPIVERKLFSGDTYLPFEAEPDAAPPFLPIGGKTLVRQTSSTHGPDGFITIDPEVIAQNQERLRNKIHSARKRLTLFEENIKKDCDTLIISYGVTSRAVADAAKTLEKKGYPVSTLTLKTLWPVPEELIQEKAAPYNRIVVVEMNLGQYVNEIKRVLCNKKVKFYGQMNGVLITPATIMEVIENE
ncbi:MAG: pyruvate flavodoxin/ferredoxin oxidoreductase [Proteobacteria bacterium]|nr:pyruvate flavodoxin/ferredoxin oxidoreductase [Pseudomonadota bacterium]MBU1585391.1 pyruvate flavodoxin/ferredoxin oxidoreductase [Pseudomonadota bacterium]MBU2453365.1 pyruvate flavodoxin/ferredoxin oxidoreductase [Pseudomonadota bacterium]MBU2630661.1 pyruvate flavodoxin/ferredoxin oxidoreductase [Pseudomonadota bacterium]